MQVAEIDAGMMEEVTLADAGVSSTTGNDEGNSIAQGGIQGTVESGSNGDGTGEEPEPVGCACDANESQSSWWWILILAPYLRRRRR